VHAHAALPVVCAAHGRQRKHALTLSESKQSMLHHTACMTSSTQRSPHCVFGGAAQMAALRRRMHKDRSASPTLRRTQRRRRRLQSAQPRRAACPRRVAGGEPYHGAGRAACLAEGAHRLCIAYTSAPIPWQCIPLPNPPAVRLAVPPSLAARLQKLVGASEG